MIEQLNQLLQQPNGSIENVYIDNLDLLTFQEKNQALPIILQKIKNGGQITIQGFDVSLLAKHILNNSIPLENINSIVEQCKSIDSMIRIEKILLESGFKLTGRRIDNAKYVLSARH